MLTIPRLSSQKSLRKQTIGILTSGGDAPGMNASVRACVRFALSKQCRVFGIQRGYLGLLDSDFKNMNRSSVANILYRGGTILKTSRCPDFFKKSARKRAAEILRNKKIDSLVVIGGDGSFEGAHLLQKETGFPTIGIPGTIDNDIYGSDDTIGFDTAVNTALRCIDQIRDTASSHDRLFLVEVMGRSCGFIATYVGIGGGAETIVVPEQKSSITQICRAINQGIERGKTSSIIVVAEGKKAGLANRLAEDLARRKYSPRVCILGHIQRGGSPTAHDRLLASVMGASAVTYLLAGYSNTMVAVQNDRITAVPFSKMIGKRKTISKDLIQLTQVLAS